MNLPSVLSELFEAHFGVKAESTQQIRSHASKRIMYRMSSGMQSALAVYNPDVPENRAFLEFGRTFRSMRLPVPEIYAQSDDCIYYLEEDLGDQTLLDFVNENRAGNDSLAPKALEAYREVITYLIRFQIEAPAKLDFTLCYQGKIFDQAAMLEDMHYFRDHLLKGLKVNFDRDRLENDFQDFAIFLAKAPANFFMYRDFQARNIMLKSGKPFFIDYQSGRLGPLQYDLASLLYQSSARLSQETRQMLKEFYLKSLPKTAGLSSEQFGEYFENMALLRCMQALGAYAKVGLQDGKQEFIKSMPLGLKTLREILASGSLASLPKYLAEVLNQTSAVKL